MGWILDTSGAIGRSPVEAPWWVLARAAGQASQVALAGVYLMMIARFVRLRRSWRNDRALASSFRRLSALLCVCAVAHAGDAVASYLARQEWLTLPSLVAALFAGAAALKLARFAGTGSALGNDADANADVDAHTNTDAASSPPFLRIVGGGEGPPPPLFPASPENAEAARNRQEWFGLRVARMEDLARRNAWLVQRRDAIDRLSDLLDGRTALDTASPPGPGSGSGPESGPSAGPGPGPGQAPGSGPFSTPGPRPSANGRGHH